MAKPQSLQILVRVKDQATKQLKKVTQGLVGFETKTKAVNAAQKVLARAEKARIRIMNAQVRLQKALTRASSLRKASIDAQAAAESRLADIERKRSALRARMRAAGRRVPLLREGLFVAQVRRAEKEAAFRERRKEDPEAVPSASLLASRLAVKKARESLRLAEDKASKKSASIGKEIEVITKKLSVARQALTVATNRVTSATQRQSDANTELLKSYNVVRGATGAVTSAQEKLLDVEDRLSDQTLPGLIAQFQKLSDEQSELTRASQNAVTVEQRLEQAVARLTSLQNTGALPSAKRLRQEKVALLRTMDGLIFSTLRQQGAWGKFSIALIKASRALSTAKKWASTVWRVLSAVGRTVRFVVVGAFKLFIGTLKTLISVARFVVKVLRSVWGALRTVATATLNAAKAILVGLSNALRNLVSGMRIAIVGLFEFGKSLFRVSRSLLGISSAAERAQSGLQKFMGVMRVIRSFFVFALATKFAVSWMQTLTAMAIREEDALMKLHSVLITTGGAAGRSAMQMKKFADQAQRVTIFSSEQILDAAGTLATFTQIAGDEFDRALQSALDVSTVFRQDLSNAIVQIGKALNDPKRGVGALRRIGVTISEVQKAAIRKLLSMNDVLGAQRIILDELELELGDVARTMRDTFSGAIIGVRNAWLDVLAALGQIFTMSQRARNALQGVEARLVAMAEALKSARAFIGGFAIRFVLAMNLVSEALSSVSDGMKNAFSLLLARTRLGRMIVFFFLIRKTIMQIADQWDKVARNLFRVFEGNNLVDFMLGAIKIVFGLIQIKIVALIKLVIEKAKEMWDAILDRGLIIVNRIRNALAKAWSQTKLDFQRLFEDMAKLIGTSVKAALFNTFNEFVAWLRNVEIFGRKAFTNLADIDVPDVPKGFMGRRWEIFIDTAVRFGNIFNKNMTGGIDLLGALEGLLDRVSSSGFASAQDGLFLLERSLRDFESLDLDGLEGIFNVERFRSAITAIMMGDSGAFINPVVGGVKLAWDRVLAAVAEAGQILVRGVDIMFDSTLGAVDKEILRIISKHASKGDAEFVARYWEKVQGMVSKEHREGFQKYIDFITDRTPLDEAYNKLVAAFDSLSVQEEMTTALEAFEEQVKQMRSKLAQAVINAFRGGEDLFKAIGQNIMDRIITAFTEGFIQRSGVDRLIESLVGQLTSSIAGSAAKASGDIAGKAGADLSKEAAKQGGEEGAGIHPLFGALLGGIALFSMFKKRKASKAPEIIPVRVVNFDDMTPFVLRASARRRIGPQINSPGNAALSSAFANEVRF